MKTARPLAAAAILLIALALGACGEKEEPVIEPEAPLQISFAKSGGIAGVSQKVRISADDAVFVSLDREPLREADVPPALIAAARNATESADLGSIEEPKPSPVADAFNYVISSGGDTVSVAGPDLEQVPELEPAISAFESIIAAASATNDGAGATGDSDSGSGSSG